MLNGLSLFSSAGVGETYIDKYISMKVANELLLNRCKLYTHFYPNVEMIHGDIRDKKIYENILEKSKEHKVNFIYATPPCQSFSKAGKQQINDDRDILFMYIIKLILELEPHYTVIENVPEFIKLNIEIDNKKTTVLNVISKNLEDKYNINYDIVDTADYGTPQTRKRAIILLSHKKHNIWKIPSILTTKKITVRDAIGHLPSLESGEKSDIHPWHKAKKHNNNHILWMSHTPEGKSAFDNEIYYPQKDGRKIKGYKTTYKRIKWDIPAPTITQNSAGISSQNNVHAGIKQPNGLYNNARALTVYELMLLTGLKSDWTIPPSTPETLIRQILGECVPPLLIYHIVSNINM